MKKYKKMNKEQMDEYITKNKTWDVNCINNKLIIVFNVVQIY